jgi:hypothetical protein
MLRGSGEPVGKAPALHGLRDSAVQVETPDRWEMGFVVPPEGCVAPAVWVRDCDTPQDKSDPPETPDTYPVDPFTIETAYECNSAGWSSADYEGRALRQLDLGVSKAMEAELWTATIAGNPSLDVDATVLASGAAVGVRQGLALLGQALSGCGGGTQGFVHAPTWVVDLWQSASLLRVDGPRLRTIVRGDVVVAGTGYPGTGEDQDEPGDGQSWVYATGPVEYRLGPATLLGSSIAQRLNRANNVVITRAEREAAVNFDPCCHFGVLIDATVTDWVV